MKSITFAGIGIETNRDAIEQAVYSVSVPAWQAWDNIMYLGGILAEINSTEMDEEAVAVEDRYGMDYGEICSLQEWWEQIYDYAKAREALAA